MWKSKRVRRLEAERDKANATLGRMLDENMELSNQLWETAEELEAARRDNKFFCEELERREQARASLAAENRRLRDDNKRLSLDRDTALEDAEEAYGHYRELRDRVETLAHRVEEMTKEMVGAVHGL